MSSHLRDPIHGAPWQPMLANDLRGRDRAITTADRCDHERPVPDVMLREVWRCQLRAGHKGAHWARMHGEFSEWEDDGSPVR